MPITTQVLRLTLDMKSNDESQQSRGNKMNMTMEQANTAIELRDAIISLFNDPKYKTVFEEGYFKAEAMRLTLAVVDNEMQDDIEQRIIGEQTRAIGHLHVYLNSAIALGNQVKASLEAEERERVDATKAVQYDDITGDKIVTEEI